MTKQIHSGIAAGQVPEGYKLEHGYVIPKEWKVVHFNECFHRLTQKNTENNQNVLTISAQQGLISQLDYYNTLYASEDKTGYFLLQKGNFAYNKSYSTDYAYGAIKQLEKYDKGIVSPLYICFSANEGTNTDFYRQYFEAGMFNREIYKIAQEGARNHGLLNVSTPEFFSAALVFPPADEQKKIAEVLSCCDRVIELKQQLIIELQQLKNGFLQAMFPAKGHSEPDIRFPEFSDVWEQRKFGEITELKSASRVHKDEWTSNGVPFYRSSDVMTAINGTENEKAFISEELYEKLSKVSGKLEEGDILVTGGGSVGNPYIVPDNKPLYTKDADLLWIKNNGKFHPYFLYEFFFSPTFRNYLGSISHVGTIAHYTITQLSDTPIGLPSFEEQKEVGEYFQSLDRLITLHQQELEETKKKKKSLAKLLLTGSVRVPT